MWTDSVTCFKVHYSCPCGAVIKSNNFKSFFMQFFSSISRYIFLTGAGQVSRYHTIDYIVASQIILSNWIWRCAGYIYRLKYTLFTAVRIPCVVLGGVCIGDPLLNKYMRIHPLTSTPPLIRNALGPLSRAHVRTCSHTHTRTHRNSYFFVK